MSRISAIHNGFLGQLSSVIVDVSQCCRHMIESNRDIRVSCPRMGNNAAGNGRHIDRSVHLGGRHVIAVLVKAALIIQGIKDTFYFISIFNLPIEAKKPDTGSGLECFQNGKRIHRISRVLQPESLRYWKDSDR